MVSAGGHHSREASYPTALEAFGTAAAGVGHNGTIEKPPLPRRVVPGAHSVVTPARALRRAKLGSAAEFREEAKLGFIVEGRVEVRLPVSCVRIQGRDADVRVIREVPPREKPQPLPGWYRRVSDQPPVEKILVLVPDDRARVEQVLDGLLTTKPDFQPLVQQELLPMPLIDEDGFLTARVLVGLEQPADFFLVKIPVVAAPCPLTPNPKRRIVDAEQLLHVQEDVEIVAAGRVVTVPGFLPAVQVDHDLIHETDLEADTRFFELGAHPSPVTGQALGGA